MPFDPLAMFGPMLGLSKEQMAGLRDPQFHADLIATWRGMQVIGRDPECLARIEHKLNAILAGNHYGDGYGDVARTAVDRPRIAVDNGDAASTGRSDAA